MLKPDSVTRNSGEYELRSNERNRLVIFGPPEDGPVPEGMEDRKNFPFLDGAMQAISWVDAKMYFGFTLTALQKRMQTGQVTHFELTGHFWGESDGMGPGERDKRRNRRERRHAENLPRGGGGVDQWDAATQAFLNGAGVSEVEVANGLTSFPLYIHGVVSGSGGVEVGGEAGDDAGASQGDVA